MPAKNKHNPDAAPDYGFKNGLDFTVINIRSGDGELRSLTPEELESLPSHGQSPEDDAIVAEQIRKTTVAEGLGGKAVGFSLVTLAGEKNSENVIIHPYAWGGDKAHPLSIAGAQAMAAASPNDLHILLDSPGVGKSDNLPFSIQKEVALQGYYGSLGEHIVKAIEHSGVIDGRNVTLQGESLGGRIAIGMAPHLENGAQSLIVNDPTGSTKQNILTELGPNFIVRENNHVKKYRDAAFDEVAAELHEQGFKIPISDMTRRLPQQFIVDSLGLTHGSLAHDLADALPNIYDEVRIISPELSELNKWEDIASVLGQVVNTAKSDTLLEQWIVHRHTHSIVSGLLPSITNELYKRRATESN